MKPQASGKRKAAIWFATFVALGVLITVLMVQLARLRRERSLAGAVLVASADPRRQSPVANVEITAEADGIAARTTSDSSGFFRLTWRAKPWQGEEVKLRFKHPGYEPLETTERPGDQLYIARLTPLPSVTGVESHATPISIADIRVRYSVKATTTINVGSTAKTFEVANTGNVPCRDRPPCSPDGKWKAAIGSLSLAAENGQEFQNVRISCIAGPCPFTKVESDAAVLGGPRITVSVRAWSDTVTFLVEAEVVHTMLTDAIRRAYPSIFGSNMTFTLPQTGQGPSIEAEINGVEIVFPLGPDLNLSWAACRVQVAPNGTKLYSCKLKPGYRFL